MGFILALDQGTTGTTALLVNDKTFELVAKENVEFPQIFPKPGWVEHNLNDIWSTVSETVKNVIAKANITASQITSIGITNQRETICSFNKKGEQLHNAIVWQDRRTYNFCESLKKDGHEDYIKKKTGLPVDPYFSGTKINWLLNNSDNIKKHHEQKDLFFGTIDTYLLYKLTNGESFYTEASNASRTLLYSLESSSWDKKLCEIIGVSESCLPEIKNSFDNFGKTKGLDFLPDDIPITGILGDQQSALFGQAGVKQGDLKCTYGTGAFILLNTGTDPFYSENGLLTTVAYKYNDECHYALEGSSYIAGAAVQWLRDNLNLIPDSPSVESLAQDVTNLDEMEHVLFFPFFTGIGSPYWKSEAKASIVGLTRDTNKGHLSLACLDGIALAIQDIIKSMRSDSKLDIESIRVDGGACMNNLLMEIQATISELEIIRPKIIETTGYGACLAAAVGNGDIKIEDIKSLWKKDLSFHPINEKSKHYKMKSIQWDSWIKKIYL